MSHTWNHGLTYFHGNADLSGFVEIQRNGETVSIPGHDLLEFVAGHVARQRIAMLEDHQGHAAILGIAHVPYVASERAVAACLHPNWKPKEDPLSTCPDCGDDPIPF